MSAESALFEWAAGELERRTGLSRLEVRGTLRLALKEAGLSPQVKMKKPLSVVVERVLPPMLKSRGVSDAAGVCALVARDVMTAEIADGTGDDSPEAIFRRMGR